ncbi:hypothetical protein ABZP36_016754 [Zizania latifolia]
MQPDPQGPGREKAGANAHPRLSPLVTAPSAGWPASVLPHKTTNVHDHYCIGKKLGQGQFAQWGRQSPPTSFERILSRPPCTSAPPTSSFQHQSDE